ncbi:DUF3718 domain-containing protein [Thalassotalea sp. PS06]|uniref:DUF3718 domain-containing protein n=1 Tax=Thalassotalea sp. PS06 TaxID=2594005 RepID=UPI001162D839|nr:DUF3718 domain-containing protein [Thalassotalea sp. PS06]QDP00437.1 DUF3718 domain-containing protein [Thalassotalea sp. PS06]
MRNVISMVIGAALALGLATSQAAEYEFIAADNSVETKTCVYAAADDLQGLKKQVRRSYDNNVRYMSQLLRCNDQDINTFAHTYGAEGTAGYLNNRVSAAYRVDESIEIIDVSKADSTNQGKVTVYVMSK